MRPQTRRLMGCGHTPQPRGQPVHSPGVGSVVDLPGRRPADGRLARQNVQVNAPPGVPHRLGARGGSSATRRHRVPPQLGERQLAFSPSQLLQRGPSWGCEHHDEMQPLTGRASQAGGHCCPTRLSSRGTAPALGPARDGHEQGHPEGGDGSRHPSRRVPGASGRRSPFHPRGRASQTRWGSSPTSGSAPADPASRQTLRGLAGHSGRGILVRAQCPKDTEGHHLPAGTADDLISTWGRKVSGTCTSQVTILRSEEVK